MASLPPQMPGQSPPDPLAQLRDIHLPGPIDSWPPAPGWWLLALLGLVLISYCIYRLARHWQNNRYRREGIKSMNDLRLQYQQNPGQGDFLEHYSLLLKRVALTRYRRDQVASLTGESWVAFLDRSGATQEFSMGPGEVLIQGNYLPHAEFDVDQLHKIGCSWIRNHRPLDMAP